MKVKISLKKSIEENAQVYFEKAKKAKKKLEGANTALEVWKKKQQKLLEKKELFLQEKENEQEKQKSPQKWYHKFRWFRTSDSFLVLGGRDATTNEIVIKKHTEKEDLVFHTDMAGSPFFVIKKDSNKSKVISKQAITQTADATCTFSRAFKLGLSTQSVFYVKPDQVTKEAQQGEYLTKGSFMIRGKTTYVENKINLAIGITQEYECMAGPFEAVEKHCEKVIRLEQGEQKVSVIAKQIAKLLEYDDLDAIIRSLPSGSFKLLK